MPACRNSASWVTRGVVAAVGRAGGAQASGWLPGVHGQQRQRPAHPAGGAGELARVAERLDEEHRELGRLVLLPPQEQVVAGDVELAADRGKRGNPHSQPGQPVGQCESQPAGLHHQSRDTGSGMPGRERGVQADAGDGYAEAVGADQPHPVPSADGQQVSFLGRVQPGGDDHHGLDRAPAALVGDRGHLGRGYRDYRQVDRFGQITDRGQARHRFHVLGVRVDRVHPPGVAAGDDVVQDGPARCARPAAGADYGHRAGLEYVPQAGHVGPAFPGGGRVQVQVPVRIGVIARQRAGEFEHPVLQMTLDAETGAGEDPLHLGVVQQDRRGQGGHAPLDGAGYQVFQQQGAESVTVHLVRHGERDFSLPAAADLVACDARDLAAAQGQQGLVTGTGRPGRPASLPPPRIAGCS